MMTCRFFSRVFWCLLCLGMLLPVGDRASARAQTRLILGVVPATTDLLATVEQAEQFGSYLELLVDAKVQVRSFAAEEQLHQWLARFREVDIGFFSEAYLASMPAGEVLPLVAGEDPAGRRVYGLLVARQGLDALMLQRLRNSLLQLHESDNGRTALIALGLGRFVPFSAAETAAFAAEAPPPAPPAPEPQAPAPRPAPAPVKAVPAVPEAPVEPAEPAPLVTQTVDGEAVTLAADALAYDQTDAVYTAEGAVQIRSGGTLLAADQVVWQATTQDAAAQGNVRLEDAAGEMTAARMQYNLATGQGRIRDGAFSLRERNFHLAGEEIERLGEASYRVTGGSFTTCDGEVPDWKFTADRLDVTLGRYLTARHVWFHLADVPLVYVPYLIYPVKTERESGMLTPWFGYSRNKGVRTSLAWYQVIDRHLDATLYLDYFSKVGVGKGLEYRYFLGEDSTGRAQFYHVSGISDTPDLYNLQWEHGGTLPGGIWLSADVEYADDRLYFEEFGEVAEEYNQEDTVATVWAQKNWDKLNAVGLLRYIKDLERDNDATLQTLPELNVAVPGYRVGDSPLYAYFSGAATNFWREEGEEGQRLYLRPALEAPLRPGSWLELTPEVAMTERLYRVGSRDEEMAVPEFALRASTHLQRVFDVDMGAVDRVQHSIEPSVRYAYVAAAAEDDLPQFDRNDRITDHNLIDYALINRLTARFAGTDGQPVYREIAWLRLSQAYDLGEARDDHADGPKRPFSDVRIELKLRPSEYLRFDLESLVPVYGDMQFRTLRTAAGLDDAQGNAATLSYNYRNAQLDLNPTEYLAMQLDTALFKPVYLRFEERYDFARRRELEKFIGLEYRAKCWSLVLTYRERYRDNEPDEQEVMVNLVLAGLSQNERISGSRVFAER